jgi:hypothetical protein
VEAGGKSVAGKIVIKTGFGIKETGAGIFKIKI